MGAVTRRTAPLGEPATTRRHRPDYWLLILSVLLLGIGLIVVYSISPALVVEKNVSSGYYITRQLIAVGLSLVAFGVTATVPLSQWKRWYKPLFVAAALMTICALLLPTNPAYPAHRWIRLGAFSFQSVELLKFALLIGFGAYLANRLQKSTLSDDWKTLRPILVFLGIVGLVVAIIQSDFGSMMVITAMMGAMIFVAGMPMRRLVLVGIALVLLAAATIAAVPYRRARISAFIHQGDTTNCSQLKTGYQACRAIVAVGSGGPIGLGLGRSVQAFGYLPEAENDSIFAIYAEKFGFIGITVLLGLFAAFFARIKRVMELAPDTFTRLLATGIFAWFATQALINIGAMLGLLPLKGITLPFISYGGTSVLFVMAAVGLLFQISRHTLFSVPRASNVNGRAGYESRTDGRRVRGSYYPRTGSRA